MNSGPNSSSGQSNLPDQIGGFRVLKLLGAGGMGQVYEGVGPEGEKIAIKVLPSYFAQDRRALALFRTECDNLRQVSSERVAKFIASGQEEKSPWLATELVEGESLKDRVQSKGPMDLKELIWFACELLHAIADLHDAGIIHGDIKPENILLTRNGKLKLIDFGISQAFGATIVDKTGTFAGSPEWMSPEAFESVNLDSTTDVFSAGSVITFAARGYSPWTQKGKGLNLPVALGKITSQEPDLQAVPEQLAQKLLLLLNKNPKSRPSARSAATMLENDVSLATTQSPKKVLARALLLGTVVLVVAVTSFVFLSPSNTPQEGPLIACAEVRHYAIKPETLSFDLVASEEDSALLSLECSTETTRFEIELCTVIEAASFEAAQTIEVFNKSSDSELPLVWDPKTDYLGCRSFEQLGVNQDKKSVGYLREVSAHPVRIEEEQTEYLAFADGSGGMFRVEFSFPSRKLEEQFIYVENPEGHTFELGWISGEPAWVFPGQSPNDFFEVTDQGVESVFCWTNQELEELDAADLAIEYRSPLDKDFVFEAPYKDVSCGEGLTERAALLPLPLIYSSATPGACMPFELVFPKTSQAERRFEFCVTMDPKKVG